MALKHTPRIVSGRLGLVALAGLGLLAGLWAGLVRIGWLLPPLQPDLASLHGPLMVGGFLGLVIALERAVALDRRWAFAAPLFAGIGSVALLVGLPTQIGGALLIVSSLLLAAIFERIYRLRPEWSTIMLIGGAATWLVGNALWLSGRPIVAIVPWWVGFLVLTIVGERLELAQVLMSGRTRAVLVAAASVLMVGLGLSAFLFTGGIEMAGVGLLALAAWLLRFDVARRSLRRPGLPRFASVALLLGYAWLAVAGVLWLLGPERVAGFWYDAMLHSVFLGFAFSMIFGHAPTIVPAISGVAVAFDRRFYVHLALLHASLVLRILSDLTAQPDARRWGGLLNEIAILLFVGMTILASRRGNASLSRGMGSTGAHVI